MGTRGRVPREYTVREYTVIGAPVSVTLGKLEVGDRRYI